MLKATVAFCALLSLSLSAGVIGVNGWNLRSRWWLGETPPSLDALRPTQWAQRQRFLLDLLLQVHKPLLQQELIDMGRELNENPNDYETGSWPSLLDFFERVHQDRILRPYSIYSLLQEELPQQLLDVYRFLVLAKDWRTFQCNACYARSQFNPVLFVHALQLAIAERADTKDLMLPAMHEVLPQLYFDKELIRAARSVSWQDLAPVRIAPKRTWKDTLGSILYPKIFRQPPEEELMPADPIVIEVKSLGVQLSLDVALNGYWSRLISRLIIGSKAKEDYGTAIIDGDLMMQFRSDEDEWIYQQQVEGAARPEIGLLLMQNIRQFVALLQLEELATGKRSVELVTPTLMTTGGVPYKATALNAEDVRQLISKSIEELQSQIDKELPKNKKIEPMWVVVQVIAAEYWLLCRHLSLAINGNNMEPSLLGMTTSNLRDPIYRSLLIQLAQLISKYEQKPKPKSYDKQRRPSVKLLQVTKLETYEQLLDTDLINLMDQQLLQSQRNNLQLLRRRLVARQLRLNHKPFSIAYELFVPETMVVQIRSYLTVPGRAEPRLLLDNFVRELGTGENRLERHSPAAPNDPTLSELYEAQAPFNAPKTCAFPHHLQLPRGTAEGLQLQLLVEVLQWHGTEIESECVGAASFMGENATLLASDTLDVVIYHQELKISNDKLE
ncbi:PREDICTED: fat-body protein 1 [Drosophila arizonae]|uniref:Fat-body protein 1 n=1 Tax=Drosophila arizonae TaxID=7263 RepID=A0ABM1P0P3_DROAR|nr:PREDICTED: fat-body protein 1 [Drosophila arizonae]